MYARLLALVCLLPVGAVAAPSERLFDGRNEIDVYSRYGSELAPSIREAMQRETAVLMESAGYRLRWLDGPREVAAAFLVVVEFAGDCNLATDAPAQLPPHRLASTLVEDGRILPFVNVDCDAVHQFLFPSLRGGLNSTLQFLYGRALGRLLAHELYHYVGQTAAHTRTGVAQVAVSGSDLLSDGLAFDKKALSKLRGSPAPARIATMRLRSSKTEVDVGVRRIEISDRVNH